MDESDEFNLAHQILPSPHENIKLLVPVVPRKTAGVNVGEFRSKLAEKTILAKSLKGSEPICQAKRVLIKLKSTQQVQDFFL